MFRSGCIEKLTVSVLLVVLVAAKAAAAQRIWIAPVPAEFDAPSRWTPFGVPSSNDQAVFRFGGAPGLNPSSTVLFDTSPRIAQLVVANQSSVDLMPKSGGGSGEFVLTVLGGIILEDTFSDIEITGNGNRRMKVVSHGDVIFRGGGELELVVDRKGTLEVPGGSIRVQNLPAQGANVDLIATDGGVMHLNDVVSPTSGLFFVDGAGAEINIGGQWTLGIDGVRGSSFRINVRDGGKLATSVFEHISNQPLDVSLVSGGSWVHGGDLLLDDFSTTINLSGGRLDIAGELTVNTQNLVKISGNGSLSTARIVGASGSFDWQNGELRITGQDGVTIDPIGNGHQAFGGDLTLNNRSLVVDETLTIAAGGRLALDGGSVVAAHLVNDGILDISASTPIESPVTNRGVINGPPSDGDALRLATGSTATAAIPAMCGSRTCSAPATSPRWSRRKTCA